MNVVNFSEPHSHRLINHTVKMLCPTILGIKEIKKKIAMKMCEYYLYNVKYLQSCNPMVTIGLQVLLDSNTRTKVDCESRSRAYKNIRK